MQIVIDIPEEVYNDLKSLPFTTFAEDIIANGTPLNDVLNKIKTEIEENVLESLSDCGDDWFAAEKVNDCLEIIDKCKTERSDKA